MSTYFLLPKDIWIYLSKYCDDETLFNLCLVHSLISKSLKDNKIYTEKLSNNWYVKTYTQCNHCSMEHDLIWKNIDTSKNVTRKEYYSYYKNFKTYLLDCGIDRATDIYYNKTSLIVTFDRGKAEFNLPKYISKNILDENKIKYEEEKLPIANRFILLKNIHDIMYNFLILDLFQFHKPVIPVIDFKTLYPKIKEDPKEKIPLYPKIKEDSKEKIIQLIKGNKPTRIYNNKINNNKINNKINNNKINKIKIKINNDIRFKRRYR